MAANVSLGTMKAQARELADMVNSRFISDSWANERVNAHARALYDMLVVKGEDYYIDSADLVVDGTVDEMPVPARFYKLRGIDYTLGGQKTPMQKFVFSERLNYQDPVQEVRYRVMGDKIRFSRKPTAQTMTCWFIPVLGTLVDDADTLDGINGWEEYVIVCTAIDFLMKEESDTSALERRKAGIEKRIQDMAGSRDAGLPETISDVTGWW